MSNFYLLSYDSTPLGIYNKLEYIMDYILELVRFPDRKINLELIEINLFEINIGYPISTIIFKFNENQNRYYLEGNNGKRIEMCTETFSKFKKIQNHFYNNKKVQFSFTKQNLVIDSFTTESSDKPKFIVKKKYKFNNNSESSEIIESSSSNLDTVSSIKEPEDNRPEDNQPEDNQPEDNQPEDNQPEDNQPEDNQPEDNQPEDNQPEDNQPEDNQPEDNQPEDNQPEDNQPEDNQPEDNQPEDNQPEDNQPEDNQPEDNQPEDNQLEENKENFNNKIAELKNEEKETLYKMNRLKYQMKTIEKWQNKFTSDLQLFKDFKQKIECPEEDFIVPEMFKEIYDFFIFYSNPEDCFNDYFQKFNDSSDLDIDELNKLMDEIDE